MYACNVKLPIVHSMYLSFHKLIIRQFLALLSLVSILCVQFIFNTENNQKKELLVLFTFYLQYLSLAFLL